MQIVQVKEYKKGETIVSPNQPHTKVNERKSKFLVMFLDPVTKSV